ncbi:MAG: YfdQ family protein [Burkholderiales bacterium]|nr:YfdQ family protein [Burkholderiales bacterium]
MSNTNQEQNILQTFLENVSTHEVVGTDEAGMPTVILSHDSRKLIDLEKFAVAPRRIVTNREFNDLRGFIDYVNDFKNESTVCFAGSKSIKVYFDYHDKENPRWCEHVAVFNIQLSNRWKIWQGANNQWMKQKAFADFCDTGLNEIIDPSQSEILTLVKNFRATVSHVFDSEATRGGGQNLSYRKTTTGGNTTNELIVLPDYITLALQPFENINVINPRLPADKQIPAYQLQAKIAWQANFDGDDAKGLLFKVQILNVENVIDETLETIKNAVVELTKIKVYIA